MSASNSHLFGRRNQAGLWFAQVEAQFALARITLEHSKFSFVISYLKECYANEVEDLIMNPPVVTTSTTLTTEIVRRMFVSEERHVRQLLLEEELGALCGCNVHPLMFKVYCNPKLARLASAMSPL